MARTTRIAALLAVGALVITACGGGEDGASTATTQPDGSTTAATTASTTAPTDEGDGATAPDGLGATAQFLATALTDEGFSVEEGDCIAGWLSDHYGGETALLAVMAADQPPADFDTAMEDAGLACVSVERLIALAGEEPEPPAATGPPPVFGGASCEDPAGDLLSEYSGWGPSIPWGIGDLAALDLSVDGDVMNITLRTHSTAIPAGGPGETPLVLRMYLAPNDPATAVVFDVELLHSTDAEVPGSVVTVTTVDVATETALSSAQYDVATTAPSLYTATLPLDAFGTAARSDFMMEVRSEWGPDHPIGSTADLEWIVDSVCNGPVLVPVAQLTGSTDPAQATAAPTAAGLADLVSPVPIVEADFTGGLPAGWYEQVWFKPAATEGQVSMGTIGVVLSGLEGNSRGGLMIDLGADVTGYSHLVAAVEGVVTDQALSGTGWNGREAPLALVVSYVDAAGVSHTGLGEDPAAPGQMFYAGFVVLPADGQSVMTNGVVVTPGAPFSFEFDLMTLDPPPATILSVAVDGGGWSPRRGEVSAVRLVAGS